jgi:hypothetical protein
MLGATRERRTPVYKVEIGGLVVQVDSVAELREVIQNFAGVRAVQATETAPAAATVEADHDIPQATPPAPKNTPRGARYAPTDIKIRSVSTHEALLKLYQKLENATHKDALRFLASKGEKGASVEEIKEALKLPEKFKLGGLTAAIRRRVPHYGLDAEQVLIIEFRGVVAGTRVLDYRLGAEMLEIMQAQGLLWKPKGGKEIKQG